MLYVFKVILRDNVDSWSLGLNLYVFKVILGVNKGYSYGAIVNRGYMA
jgi:hypothetical protein